MMSKSAKSSKEDIKKLEEKIGEVLGLERAAQKAVEEINAMKLLDSSTKKEVLEIREEANSHEEQIKKLISDLSKEN
ncbi:MAG: hypothetical protein ACTHKK_04330 [Candidatus Nitrosocosmicus sp.]